MKLKKSRLLVAAVLLLALVLPVRAADDWAGIGESDDGTVFYLRRPSIEDNGSYVSGWVKGVLSDTAKSDPSVQMLQSLIDSDISSGVILFGAQKGSRQVRIIQIAYYDKNDNMLFSLDESIIKQFGIGDWMHCIPDSDNEMIWEALMKAAGVKY